MLVFAFISTNSNFSDLFETNFNMYILTVLFHFFPEIIFLYLVWLRNKTYLFTYQSTLTDDKLCAGNIDSSLYTPNVEIIIADKNKTTQLTFTCSKSTVETLEKGVKYVQINTKNTRTTSFDIVLVFLLLTLNIFHSFF